MSPNDPKQTLLPLVKYGLCLVGIAVASVIAAAIAVRVPGVWMFYPDFFVSLVVTAIEPRTQEVLAAAEFTAFAIWSFIWLAAAVFAFGFFRARHRNTA
jgi:hypothetical protein